MMLAIRILFGTLALATFYWFALRALRGPGRPQEDFNPDQMSDSWRGSFHGTAGRR